MANKANPLADNTNVQELFSIMKENGKDTAELTALLGYVKQMENFVKSAEGQIADMKSQIMDMKEIQKHPIKTALVNTVDFLQAKVAGVKSQLNRLRNSIVQACKNAVAAVKDTGVAVLDSLAGFAGIKKTCEQIQKDCNLAMARCDKSVSNIERFSNEYHQTGLHLKNMLRMVMGKDVEEKPKEAGALAKAMCAPYKAHKKCLNSICKTAGKAMDKLDVLNQNAKDIRQERQEHERKDPAAEHLTAYEAKAKEINAANAAAKGSNVLDFKPKTHDEAVTA